MIRRINALVVLAALAVLVSAHPAVAQTGRMQGTVTNAQGMPVEGATVAITQVNGSSKYEAKTKADGSYIQIGLIGGVTYLITVTKDDLKATRQVPVRGDRANIADFTLAAGSTDGVPKEAPSLGAQLQQMFAEGLDLSRAGKHDDAIAKFASVAQANAACSDCYYNIGYSYQQKKEYDKAEEAYKKAIEIKPNYADAYTGLANIYTAQRKFDLAADASAKALEFSGAAPAGAPGAPVLVGAGGGGASAEALFNQGVTLWNGGKIADAKKQFEAAIAVDPKHAESHYQLAMALINEGNLKGAAVEFDTYLKLSPTGPNAAQAKAISAQLPK